MLSSLDKVINAGIRFETETRDVDKAESKLNDLRNAMSQAAAGGVALSEGTNKANRSLNKQAASASGASTGLAGLQSQIASTRVAQEALENSSGDITDALHNMDAQVEGLDMSDKFGNMDKAAQDMVVNDIVNELTGNLDELADAPEEFSLDYFVDGEDDVEELVRNITKLSDNDGENILGGKRDPDLPSIEAVRGMDKSIRSFRDADFGDKKFEKIFGEYDKEERTRDFPLDPRAKSFPDSDELGGMDPHIFDQLSRNSPYDTFAEMMEDDSTHPSDFLQTAKFDDNFTREIGNYDGEGTSLFTDQIKSGLEEQGIKNVDDFFRASDSDINEALAGTPLGQGEYGLEPDELRGDAVSAIGESTIDDKDMSEIGTIEKGKLGIGLDEVRQNRTTKPSPTDLFPKIDNTIPESDEEILKSANELAFLMDEYDEINEAVQGSTNLHDARNKVANMDSDGLVQLNRWVDKNRDSLAKTMVDADDVVQRLGAVENPEEFHRTLRDKGGFSSDGEAEAITNMMSELDPSLIKGQGAGKDYPITRETLGLRTMQKMMDTDPDSDRQKTLQSILQSIYHPTEGIQQTLFDDEDLMKGGFYEGLSAELPNNLTSRGGYGDNLGENDVAREITDEFLSGEGSEGDGIEDYLGKDSKNVGDAVSRAVNKFDYDDKNVIGTSSKATEDFLPDLYEKYASQLAPGLDTSSRGSTKMGMTDLFPGQDDVLDPKPNKDDQVIPNFDSWMDEFRENMEMAREAQRAAGNLRGGAYTGLFGGDGNKKGLFGFLSETFARSDFSPRRVAQFNEALEQTNEQYKRMLPLFKVTSFNLGAMNVDFEGLGTMAFKLTALLGPLIAALTGLAGAFLTATAAMGMFMGAGALNFFGDMEDTMAGVSSKGEAMKELASTLGKMAGEALMPLRMARLGGDGNTAAQSFVELLRGALQILNRISNIFAYVMELDTVAEEAERIKEFLLNSDGDSELARQFGELVEQVLPLINDIVIAILGNMGALADFTGDITRVLGDEMLDTLGSLKPLLGILTSYGAGFFTFALKAIALFARLADMIIVPLAWIAKIATAISGVKIEVNDLAFAIGAVVGSLAVLSAMGSFVSSQMFLIASSFKGLAWVASLATTANYGLASSFAVVAATAGLVVIQLWLIRDVLKNIKALDPEFSLGFAADLGWVGAELVAILAVAGQLARTLGAFKGLGTIFAKVAAYSGVFSGELAVAIGLLKWAGSAIAGIITGISVVTAGWIVLIGAIIIGLADMIFYLKTGESFLFNWEGIFARIAKHANTIKEAIQYVNSVRRGGFEVGGAGERFQGAEYTNRVTGETNTVDRKSDFAPDGSTAKGETSFTINVDQSMNDKDIARIAKREIKNWWNRMGS